MHIKKIVFFVFIVASIIIINDLGHSIYNLWQKSTLLDRSRQLLSQEKKANLDLKKRLEVVREPGFVEEEARNRLFLVKHGEGIVIVAPTVFTTPSPALKPVERESKIYWKQWMDVFLKGM
jgi:cell division protein FtsB